MSVLGSISTQQEPVCSLEELMLGTQSLQSVHFVGLHHSSPAWSEEHTTCCPGLSSSFHFLQKKPDWALWEHSAMQSTCCQWRWGGDSAQEYTPDQNENVTAHSLCCLNSCHSNRLLYEQWTARTSWKHQLMLNLSQTGYEALYSQTGWCSSFNSQPGASTEHGGFIEMKTCRETPQLFYPVSKLRRIRQSRSRQDWLEM